MLVGPKPLFDSLFNVTKMFWNFLCCHEVLCCILLKISLLNVTFIWFSLRCVFLFDLNHFNPVSTIFGLKNRYSDSFHSYVISKISNSLSFITKFITSLAKMILCSAEPGIISYLPTHVINLVINDTH